MNVYRVTMTENRVKIAWPEPVVPWDATDQAGVVTCWFASDPDGCEAWTLSLTPLGGFRGNGLDLVGVGVPGQDAIPVKIVHRGPMPMLVSACPA